MLNGKQKRMKDSLGRIVEKKNTSQCQPSYDLFVPENDSFEIEKQFQSKNNIDYLEFHVELNYPQRNQRNLQYLK